MLIVTPGFAANISDDTCVPPLQLMVKELCRRQIQVHIIALEYPFSQTPYQWHGAMVYPCNGANRRWLRWRTRAHAEQYARRVIQSGTPKIIQSFWLGHAWQVGLRLSEKYQIPHFTTMMGQDVLWKSNWWNLRRLRSSAVTSLIALSDFHAAQLEAETGMRPGAIVPWGIDSTEFGGLLPADNEVDILGAGSFLPIKNWSLWINTLAKIVASKPDVRALLIGDGPERKSIQQEIARLGLSANVRLTGSLPRYEVLRLMKSARVFLHTSRFESFGYVLVEAAAAGCRVVSTPVGVAPQLAQTSATDEGLTELVINALAQKDRCVQMPFLMDDTVDRYLHLHLSPP